MFYHNTRCLLVICTPSLYLRPSLSLFGPDPICIGLMTLTLSGNVFMFNVILSDLFAMFDKIIVVSGRLTARAF